MYMIYSQTEEFCKLSFSPAQVNSTKKTSFSETLFLTQMSEDGKWQGLFVCLFVPPKESDHELEKAGNRPGGVYARPDAG